MSRTHQAQVVVSRCDDGTFVVLDALQREHMVDNPRELGDLLARLVQDPDLPEPVVASPTQALLEEGFAKIARRANGMPEELAVAAGRVGASVGTQVASAVADAARGIFRRRAEKKTQASRPTKAAPKAVKNGAPKRRPSSVRFEEDR